MKKIIIIVLLFVAHYANGQTFLQGIEESYANDSLRNVTDTFQLVKEKKDLGTYVFRLQLHTLPGQYETSIVWVNPTEIISIDYVDLAFMFQQAFAEEFPRTHHIETSFNDIVFSYDKRSKTFSEIKMKYSIKK